MAKTVLVCGGAGYIGSHLVRELVKQSYKVVVFDNLSTALKESQNCVFVLGDIRDRNALDAVFAEHKPSAVFHMCASIVVSESCTDPLKYFDNNVSGTVTLLQAMHAANVKYFIFSSTAAIFGMPERIPIQEDDKKFCLNPYGDSKLMVEQILARCEEAYGMRYICLRYFNACGADEHGDIGELHHPETHLIPLVLQVAQGKREKVMIFGEDYDTSDGTCVRDYVHVSDLAVVHILALEYMIKENKSDAFNLGNGKGYSVKEIIEAARRVTKHPIPVQSVERRAGDAATLIASSDKTESVLKWKKKYDTIDSIVASAWNFHQKHPNGF